MVWPRIIASAGQEFHQFRGQAFTYRVLGDAIVPSTTAISLGKSQFARALDRWPVSGPGELQDLFGPSYLYAILSDVRVHGPD